MTQATSNVLAANAAGAQQLADDAVDTNAIQDDAVTLAKLAHGTADRFLGFDAAGVPAELDAPQAAATWSGFTLSSASAHLPLMFPAGYDAYEFLATGLVASDYGDVPGIQFYDGGAADDWITAVASYSWVDGGGSIQDGASPSGPEGSFSGAIGDTSMDLGINMDDEYPITVKGVVANCGDAGLVTEIAWHAFGYYWTTHPNKRRVAVAGGGHESTAHTVTGMRLVLPTDTFNAGATIFVRGIKHDG
ncbi:MAG: hypothetical protein H6907_11550 [Hyphomicrobiales bacterium]|nr:hypothetical protein [Hyphomicrobiales bacterium]